MKLTLSLIALAGASLAIPAQAATARMTPDEIAQCVVDNALRDVKAFLASVPGSADEAASARAVLDYYGACDDNRVADGRPSWRERAEIARAALLTRTAGHQPDLSITADAKWQLTALGNPASYDETAVGLRRVGDCVVTNAPDAAMALVKAEAGGAAERSAIAQLSPALAGCVAAGQNFRLKREDLRLLVAEPLYHLVSR